MYFGSDTSAPAHPAILAAVCDASSGPAPSYGADRWTAAAMQALCETFECDLDLWLVSSGTAANALALATICPPTQCILCHEEAHIERDERGAPEFYTGGAKLSLLPGDHARIDVEALRARLAANKPNFVHEAPACVLSLSNLNESGAAYSAEATAELAGMAHAAGLLVHLDGARFANVVASSRRSPADLTWKAGVDVMSFGATKNGALGCEAVLLFGETRSRAADLRARAKRAGLMPPKMRFLGAQMAAYLQDGLWLDLAGQANASAAKLAQAFERAGGRLTHPCDGNEVFVDLPKPGLAALDAAGAVSHGWLDGSRRFVCSWATSDAEIEAVVNALSA